ncbi:glycosyl hydrolase [Caldicellulosiruptor morganii]|uniref:Glycoside hydrolase family 26 protein n=1 Tax=Caldicellulosiruptor morganii TaxID=1387555 RepID=A0ABY7BNJ0_9FIRM|nr:glycosyl hydrolase [Caldicellulosiruptor morganii]WAM33611.1 glycoside hydrolase family 26 protein [Caldicellulosiruptor morganii]
MKISKGIKEAILNGVKIIKEDTSDEYVYSAVPESDKFEIEFCLDIKESGYYALYLYYKAEKYAKAVFLVDIDGLCYGDVRLNSESYEVSKLKIGEVFLENGQKRIKFYAGWGIAQIYKIELEKIHLQEGTPLFKLTNQLASDKCKKLIEYFSEIYSRAIIAGQHTNTAVGSEISYIEYQTGKRPALRGFDFLSYTKHTVTNNMTYDAMFEVMLNRGSVEEAIKWHRESGGIVTFCWHWFSPTGGNDKTFYTKNTDFDLEAALCPDTKENKLLMEDIYEIGKWLKVMADADVPVIFRPLHEADGRWFWWGAKGPKAYKELYYLLYDVYTNYFKLNNLIWVWNTPHPDWKIEEEYYDIAGVDFYAPAQNYGPISFWYNYIYELTGGKKPIALTEDGPIPDPDKLQSSKTYWLWFMPWWGGFTTDGRINSFEHLKNVYNHPYVITLDRFDLFRR